MSRIGQRIGVSVVLLQACGAPAMEDGPDATAGGTGDTGDTGEPDESLNCAISVNKDVDILFVIDNSGSMAEEQALLVANFAAFVDLLEAEDVAINYRIGITTTDAGNPRCVGGVPENGTLVLSSCLDRVASGEFVFADQDYSFACADHCTKTDAQLTVRPTTTHYDPQPRPRRWIERIEGQSNIEGVASNVEAFQCYGPQGVAGCGFESHLESMYRALAKAEDPGSTANYGFLRDAAVLSIVVITDETDCSYRAGAKEVFVDNKVFWNSPDDVQPSSALCWRAGVECSGDSPYSECHAANHGVDGAVGVADADAVLRPVSEYVAFVKAIEASKQLIDASQRVLVSVIGGVPVGYQAGAAELVYADAWDPGFQADFGIGPGCVRGDPKQPSATAVPPVREREFAEAFAGDDGRNLYSICQDNYGAALAAIADRFRAQITPACVPGCVRDLDPGTAVTDPGCHVYDVLADGTKVEILPCVAVDGAWARPPGAAVCYASLVDVDGMQTPGALDDMSTFCADLGVNLEFKVFRADVAPPGATMAATCERSDDAARDCPGL